ncbi:hypothetical protein OSCI_3460059 [Kamptonema sp. PCC 6506]|nr:hypothetical protein OSCI_3460059 [Kamptonema sp. PCC 6506]
MGYLQVSNPKDDCEGGKVAQVGLNGMMSEE